MTSTKQAVIDAWMCRDCGAGVGQMCQDRKGRWMSKFHTKRMLCPICKKPYAERSGNGFRHFNVGWCRLPQEERRP
jgi:hypothetical protein